jgi:hypothetical protein
VLLSCSATTTVEAPKVTKEETKRSDGSFLSRDFGNSSAVPVNILYPANYVTAPVVMFATCIDGNGCNDLG